MVAATSQEGPPQGKCSRRASARFRYSAAFLFTPSRRAGDGSPGESRRPDCIQNPWSVAMSFSLPGPSCVFAPFYEAIKKIKGKFCPRSPRVDL